MERSTPSISYDNSLPIVQHRQEIIEAVKRHQVVIISGDTGSGKTTQIPKFCLEAGLGERLIGCTQPRRIAAVTIAARISEELGPSFQGTVGYKIRFQEEKTENQRIKLMTDGILLNELHSDPLLKRYDCLIIDEAHERSLNIDFALGFIKRLLNKRKDLKLIVTSATIDTRKFSAAFDNAPVIEVSGRLYPVDVVYSSDDDETDESSFSEKALPVIRRILKDYREGDILVFMPTENDIRETMDSLSGISSKYQIQLLPLYARLPTHEQKKIFKTDLGRKIVIATNIAETSLTVPGIRFVVDTGTARILHYHPTSGTYGLPVEPVSRSSADQRKGRCGRVQSGICFRLFTEESYLNRQLFTKPEILRTNLADVVLKMLALDIDDDVMKFPFIDPPSSKGINDAFTTLLELGAIKKEKSKKDRRYSLTKIGRHMSHLPLDPRLSRIVLQAGNEGVLKEILPVIAALSIQDPRDYPADKLQAARDRHKEFQDERSDFLFFHNVWTHLEKKKKAKEIKAFCQTYYFSFRRVQEWKDLHHQLKSLVKENEIPFINTKYSDDDSFYAALHRSLAAGFLSHLAHSGGKNQYTATKNREAMLFPGSSLFNHSHSWIIAAEYVKTSRLFARTNGQIEVDWLLDLAGHLIKKRYHSPFWSRKKGTVLVLEQSRLYGFLLEEKAVPYKKINPDEACDIFIREALINEDLEDPDHYSFIVKNRCLRQQVTVWENKIRQRNLAVSDDELAMKYKEKLPSFADLSSLNRYLKDDKNADSLCFDLDDFISNRPDSDIDKQYPDTFRSESQTFQLSYQFTPGEKGDGVTIVAPLEKIGHLKPEILDWAVPALLEERIIYLLKSLPKPLRKKLIPIADTAKEIIPMLDESGTTDLKTALAQALIRLKHIDIHPSDFTEDEIPEHLRTKISVVDKTGKELRNGYNLAFLMESEAVECPDYIIEKVARRICKGPADTWVFGDIPKFITEQSKDRQWTLYPGLAEEDGQVALTVFSGPEERDFIHQKAVAALCGAAMKKELLNFRQMLEISVSGAMALVSYDSRSSFSEKIWNSVLMGLYGNPVYTEKEFFLLLKTQKAELFPAAEKAFSDMDMILRNFNSARSYLEKLLKNQPSYLHTYLAERLEELRDWSPPELLKIPAEHWYHIPEILENISIRVERGILDISKDAAKDQGYQDLWENAVAYHESFSSLFSQEKQTQYWNWYWDFWTFRNSLFNPAIKLKTDQKLKSLRSRWVRIKEMV